MYQDDIPPSTHIDDPSSVAVFATALVAQWAVLFYFVPERARYGGRQATRGFAKAPAAPCAMPPLPGGTRTLLA